jgi:hypothetical protein
MPLALTSTWVWYRLHMPMVRPPPTLPALWLVPCVFVQGVHACVRALACVCVYLLVSTILLLHIFAQIIKQTVHTK